MRAKLSRLLGPFVCFAVLAIVNVVNSPATSLYLGLPLAFLALVYWPGSRLIVALGFEKFGRNEIENFVWSFSFGFAWLTFICGATTLLQWSLGSGLLLLVFSAILFEALSWRHLPPRPVLDSPRLSKLRRLFRVRGYVWGALLLAFTYGWFFEAPILGEEVVELISVRKILESPFLELHSLLHTAGALPTYILMPYCFLIAAIAKASGLSLFVTYVKLRAFWVVLAIATYWCLQRALLKRGSIAFLGILILAIWVIVDPLPLSWPASFLPLTRRGAFAAAVLLPGMILILIRFAQTPRRLPFVAYFVGPVLILSCLITHALEGLFFLFFVAAFQFTGVLCVQKTISRKRLGLLSGSIVFTAFAFSFIHGRIVGHIRNYLAGHKAAELAKLKIIFETPLTGFWSAVPEQGHYIFAQLGSVAYYVTAALIALPVIMYHQRFFGLLVWSCLSLIALVFGFPLFMHAFYYATTPDIYFVSAHLSLWGFMGFSLLLIELSRTITTQAQIIHARLPLLQQAPLAVLLTLPVAGLLAILTMVVLHLVFQLPSIYPATSIVTFIFWWCTKQRKVAAPLRSQRLITAAIAIVLTGTVVSVMKNYKEAAWNGERSSLFCAISLQREIASVVDWPQYYAVLQATANPPFDAPIATVESLRRILPPLATVIYDPKYAYSLPMFVNIYVANPGHYLTSDQLYYDKYVSESAGVTTHPVFNESNALGEKEFEFLRELQVKYVVVNPRTDGVVAPKLATFPDRFRKIWSDSGYSVYEVRL